MDCGADDCHLFDGAVSAGADRGDHVCRVEGEDKGVGGEGVGVWSGGWWWWECDCFVLD